MTRPQVILDETGAPAFAVIPWDEYTGLIVANQFAEEASLSDEEFYARAKAKDEESFPNEVVKRLLADENPVRVYRAHRGMTRKQLADAVGISESDLTQIESGQSASPVKQLSSIAKALGVDADDLI